MTSISTSPKISHSERNQQLEAAVHSRDLEKLARLLSMGADPAARHGKAFFMAVTSEFAEGAKLLFDTHAGRDSTLTSIIDTALERVSKREGLLSETSRLLISWGARSTVGTLLEQALNKNDSAENIIFLCKYCQTPKLRQSSLQWAAEHGRLELVKFLRRKGTDISSNDNNALKVSAKNGHLDVVKFLLKHGDNCTTAANQALIEASSSGHLNVVKFLLRHRAGQTEEGNQTDYASTKNRALLVAAEGGHLDVVQLMVEHGASPGYIHTCANHEPPVQTPLTGAAANGHADIVRFLWELGADVAPLGNIALRQAAHAGYHDVVELLCKLGADVAEDDNHAIRVAARNGHSNAVKVLLEYGADMTWLKTYEMLRVVESHDDSAVQTLFNHCAKTPDEKNLLLCVAAETGNLTAVQNLVAHGADIATDRNYPIRRAAENGHHEVVEYLCKHGADAQALQNDPIRSAAQYGHLNVIKVLCRYGAQVATHNNSVIHLASKAGYIDIVQYLCRQYPDTFLGDFGHIARYFAPLSQGIYSDPFVQEFKSYFLKNNQLSQRLRDALCYTKTPGTPDYFDQLIELVTKLATGLCTEARDRTGEISERLFRRQLAAFEHMAAKDKTFSFSDAFDRLLVDAQQLSNLQDVIRRVALEIRLPALASQSHNANVRDLQIRAYSLALDDILADRDLRTLIKLSRFMHSPIATLPTHLRPYLSGISWPPLFKEPIELSPDLSIVALSSQGELEAEGEALAHCVGDGHHATACSTGKTQILSLRKNGVSVATLEFALTDPSHSMFRSSSDRWWSLSQFKGHGNSAPSQECVDALHTFLALAADEKIAFNPLVEHFNGVSLGGFHSFLSPLEQLTGIPQDEPELLEGIAKHYLMVAEKFNAPIATQAANGVLQLQNISACPEVSRSALNKKLEEAVTYRDLEGLRELLEQGANPAARHGKAFYTAACSEFPEGAKLLYASHAERDDTLTRVADAALKTLTDHYEHYDYLSETGKMLIACGTRKGVDIDTLLRDSIEADDLKNIIFLCKYSQNQELRREILYWAAEHGHLALVKFLRRTGSRVTPGDSAALMVAAKNGHLSIVKFLYNCGASIDACNNAALIDASSHGHIDVVRFLFKHGADPLAQCNSAIDEASAYGHLSVVRFLCSTSADVPAYASEALCQAILRGHCEVAQCLIDHGAFVPAEIGFYMSEAASGGSVDIVRLLCTRGLVDSKAKNHSLLRAARNGHIEVVQLLIEHGAEPGYIHTPKRRGARCRSPLAEAAGMGHTATVKLLWELGAEVGALDNLALRRAVRAGHYQVVELLCQLGADVTVRNNRAMLATATNNHRDIATLLSTYGASLELCDDNQTRKALEDGGINAIPILQRYGASIPAHDSDLLCKAAKIGNLDAVKVLCRSGADVTANDNYPIRIAAQKGHAAVVELLCKRGAHVIVRDNEPICQAAQFGHLEVVKVLCRYGADARARNNYPFRIALRLNYNSIARFFLDEYPDTAQHFFDFHDYRFTLTSMDSSHRDLFREFKSYCLSKTGISPRLRDALTYKKHSQELDYFDTFITQVTALASHLTSSDRTLTGEIAEQLFRRQLATFERMALKDKKLSFSDTFDQLLADAQYLPHLRDVIQRVAVEVVLPQLAQESTNLDPHGLKQYAYISALQSILAKRDLRDLVRLNRFMHSPIAILPAHLRPYVSNLWWQPLFTEPIQLSPEFSIVALSSQEELVAEGKALAHCVGDGQFATRCSMGQQQILSLRKQGVSVATIELSLDQTGVHLFSSSSVHHWSLTQFKEHGNSPPSPESEAAFQRFIDSATSNQIMFNPLLRDLRGSPLQDFRTFISPLEQVTGIPEDETELVNEIAKHYLMLAEKFGEPIFHLSTSEKHAYE